MRTEELYRSANLLVRAVRSDDDAHRAARWVVTFDAFVQSPDLARPGFGEAFLRARGWSAIHVIGIGNDWYQYDDLPRALAAVRACVAGAARTVAYGSSMGAYAALRCAEAAGADAVLALSPQYSIEPRIVPWEKRWLDDGHRIRWQPHAAQPLSRRVPVWLLFDPADADRRHADRIAAETGCTPIPLPHAGHPVTTFLGEVHLLAPLVAEVRAGEFDPAAFRRLARARRRESSVYLSHLALAQPPARPRLALRLAEMACTVAPGSSFAGQHLATIHRRAGRHAEAIAMLEEAVATTERHDAVPLYALAEALLEAGQADAALERMAEAIALAPHLIHLRVWQARALLRAGRVTEAVAMQAEAVALAPNRRAYRSRLRHYRLRLLASRIVAALRGG